MVEVIHFSQCAFLIGDLDCTTLLDNIHILCIILSEITLIGAFPVSMWRGPGSNWIPRASPSLTPCAKV
jgi:hypothetical protein